MQVQVCALVKHMYLFLNLFLSMAQCSHSAVATKKAQKAQKLQSHNPTKLKQWKDDKQKEKNTIFHTGFSSEFLQLVVHYA